MTTAHGLVIGKFYPPHAGHHLLVRAAAAQCSRVSVIVMAASQESIPLARRVAWLREAHQESTHVAVTGIVDDVRIDYADSAVWDAHVALMKQALAAIEAPPVTAVFSSESYGAELARRFSAQPVILDPGRVLAPVSGTRVRADVPGHWHQLAAATRAGLALRVVVVGAESTGTTTLSQQLAQHLRLLGGAHGLTRWVAEYGREYSAHKYAAALARAQLAGEVNPGFGDLGWAADEFEHIARSQWALAEVQARQGGPVLVCDTDAFATTVWHERYLGCRLPQLEQWAGERHGDLYLLTHHDGVPFEQDGLRDGQAIRAWMTARFGARLQESGWRHAVLRGCPGQRLARAAQAVEALLAEAWRFAPPLGA